VTKRLLVSVSSKENKEDEIQTLDIGKGKTVVIAGATGYLETKGQRRKYRCDCIMPCLSIRNEEGLLRHRLWGNLELLGIWERYWS